MGSIGNTVSRGYTNSALEYLNEYDATSEDSMEYFQADNLGDAIAWLDSQGMEILDNNSNGDSGTILYADPDTDEEYELEWEKDYETGQSISGRMTRYEHL